MRIWIAFLIIFIGACQPPETTDCATPGKGDISNCLCAELKGDKIENIDVSEHTVVITLNNQLDDCTRFCGVEGSEEWSRRKIKKMMIAIPVMIFGLDQQIEEVQIQFMEGETQWNGKYSREELQTEIPQEFSAILSGWKKARFQAEVLQNKEVRERIFNRFVAGD